MKNAALAIPISQDKAKRPS